MLLNAEENTVWKPARYIMDQSRFLGTCLHSPPFGSISNIQQNPPSPGIPPATLFLWLSVVKFPSTRQYAPTFEFCDFGAILDYPASWIYSFVISIYSFVERGIQTISLCILEFGLCAFPWGRFRHVCGRLEILAPIRETPAWCGRLGKSMRQLVLQWFPRISLLYLQLWGVFVSPTTTTLQSLIPASFWTSTVGKLIVVRTIHLSYFSLSGTGFLLIIDFHSTSSSLTGEELDDEAVASVFRVFLIRSRL